MHVCFLFGILFCGIFREVNGLNCYACDSSENKLCSQKPVKDKKLIISCPSTTDVCGIIYTSSIDTLKKLSIKQSCITQEELEQINTYGPGKTTRKKVKESNDTLLKLVQLQYFICNESLCNTQLLESSDVLECYICSSTDKHECDYEGTSLTSHNNTFLSRCSSSASHCALSYKIEPGGTVTEAEVSRMCMSTNELTKQRSILGEGLVGMENNMSKLETHLFVCNTSGCNTAFPDENTSISCIICNDVNHPECDLDGSKLSDKPDLLQPCSTTAQHYCLMWYKVDLRLKETQNVVRSCVTKAEALRYKKTYGNKSLSGIFAKMDYPGKASYHMTVCGSSGCNAHFPQYSQQDLMCYVCSPPDSDCGLDGSQLRAINLKSCDSPDDICSMSFRVHVDQRTIGQPNTIVRKCISRQRADKFLEVYGDENDVAIFEEDSAPGVDTYMYFCYFPQCNDKFPPQQEEILSVRAPLRCYNCHSLNDKDCGYDMTNNIRQFITVCPNTEDFRCFMSFEVKSTGDGQYNINRTCAPAKELLALKDRYGRNLVAMEGEGPDIIEHHMFHCHYPLCNRNFPDSNRTTISCYECAQEENSNCDLNGEKLAEFGTSLLVRCSSHDAHVCAIVLRHNSQTDKVTSVTRKCMPIVQADFYKANYGETPIFADENDVDIAIYMSFCASDSCNVQFPRPELLVQRKPKAGHEAAGQLIRPQDPPAAKKPEAKEDTPDSKKPNKAECSCSGKWVSIVFMVTLAALVSDQENKIKPY